MPYREITTRGITLLCFPFHDGAFVAIATRHVAAMDHPTPARLQVGLQATYPKAVVRERESFATLHGGEAWYVYRDGRYSPFATEDTKWWEAADSAFIVVDAETGKYVKANEAAAALVGLDQSSLLTLRAVDLLDTGARKTVSWVVQLLQDVGELHSTAMLRTPDGRRIAVEYRLVRDAADPGRMVSYLRAVPSEAADASDAPPGNDNPDASPVPRGNEGPGS